MRCSEDPEEGWIEGRKSSTSEARAKAEEPRAKAEEPIAKAEEPRAKAVSRAVSQESKHSVYDPEQSPMIDGNKYPK